MPIDRRGLEQALLLGRQAVDARRQHRLHRGGHLDGWRGPAPGDRPRSPTRMPVSDQRAHALFQEEGIALRALRSGAACERRQAGVVSQERLEEFVGTGRRQRVQPQLRVVGLAAPAVLVLRPVVDQQQERAVGRLSTRLSSSAWVSVSIQCRSSKTSSERLHLALAQQDALERRRACAGGAAVDRAVRNGLSSGRRVQERQERRNGVLQRRVERQDLRRSPWPGWCARHRAPRRGI